MFNSFKKAKTNSKNTKNIIKDLKKQGINIEEFRMFLEAKNLNFIDTTDELITEFNNRDNLIMRLAIPCSLTLPEMYNDVNNFAGATVGLLTGNEHNFTSTSRKQIKVNTKAIIVPNGIVFKGALNNTKDLRVAWEDITDCKIETENKLGVIGFLQVGVIRYPLFTSSNKYGTLFFKYVKGHMAGPVDDGWS